MAEKLALHFAKCAICSRTFEQQAKRPETLELPEECLDEEILAQIIEKAKNFSVPDPKAFSDESSKDSCESIPRSIGRYSIIDEAGRGSFGIVFRALHPLLKRSVALKLSHRQFNVADSKVNFFKEAETASCLDHPNIVSVLDADRLENGQCFIVFQFLEGTTLEKYCSRVCQNERQLVSVFSEVLKGIQHAHKLGIIHRDLKPSNILVQPNGIPKVTDFGLSYTKQNVPTHPEFAGTLRYMSPEQARCEIARIDATTDIFALGIILFELLTKSKVNRTVDELSKGIDPSRLDSDLLPRELIRICRKCCAIKQSDRYLSAFDLKEDLDSWQQLHRYYINNPSQNIQSNGLQPYGSEHAAMFKNLALGPKRFDGLADSIGFWKRRIERRGFEPTFPIGLITGPTGCGKTSLVNAGIIPSLSIDTRIVTIDLRKTAYSNRLVNRDSDSSDKTLVVLDHFSNHCFLSNEMEQLVSDIRQCSGDQLQYLVIAENESVKDVLELVKKVGTSLVPRENMMQIPAIEFQEAILLLKRLGESYGCIKATNETTENIAFIEAAVQQMSRAGSLDLPTIQVFFGVVRSLIWNMQTLTEIGSVDSWRFLFMNEHFRLKDDDHDSIVRVLASIFRHNESRTVNLDVAIAKTGELEKSELLLRSLELTPPIISHSTQIGAFVFSQEYLIPILKSFVDISQIKATWSAKSILAFQYFAFVWNSGGSNRKLASPKQLVTFAIANIGRQVSPIEKKFFRASLRNAAGKYTTLLLLLAVVCWIAAIGSTKRFITTVENSRADEIESVAIPRMHIGLKQSLNEILRDGQAKINSRLNAVYTLSRLGECPIKETIDLMDETGEAEFALGIQSLLHNKQSALEALNKRIPSASDLNERTRLAFLLASLGENQQIDQITCNVTNPDIRIGFITIIREHYSPQTILNLCKDSNLANDTTSALLNSIPLAPKSQKTSPFDQSIANDLFFSSNSMGIQSAARRILVNSSNSGRPSLRRDHQHKNWFYNSYNMAMIRLPETSDDQQTLFMASLPVQYKDVVKFLASKPEGKFPYISNYPAYKKARMPAGCVLKETAFEFCNELSRIDGREPYYEIDGSTVIEVHGKKRTFPSYRTVQESDGYRIPLLSNWKRAVFVKEGLSYLGTSNVPDGTKKLFANFGAGKPLKSGSLLPNRFGFFDLLGNTYELCQESDSEEISVVLVGGVYVQNADDILKIKHYGVSDHCSPLVSFRVCCPTKNQ